MVKTLVAWFVGASLLGLTPGWAQDWPAVIAKAKQAIVPVLVEPQATVPPELICTGVVVAPLRVVTEQHCLIHDDDEHRPWVGPFAGRVINRQGQVLLIALDQMDPAWRPLTLTDRRPMLGEPVAALGYAFATSTLFVTIGTVATEVTPQIGEADHPNDELWFNLQLIGGMSGGAIVNAKGQLVSLSRGIRSDGWGSPNSLAYGAGWSSLYRLIGLWR